MKKILAFVLSLLCAASVRAQAVNANARIAELSSLGKISGEYRLGPGDLIEVSVFGVDSFRHLLRVSASGQIKLPLVEPVNVAGLTAAELEQRLAAVLDGDVIQNPQVSVFVKEYRSQPVFVLGSVRTPGQYQISQPLNLVDVLSMAGGLQQNAADEAVIQRRTVPGQNDAQAPSKEFTVIKVNLRQLLEQADLSLNIPVQGGDVIHVEERQPRTVYVIGEVNRAGAFQLPAKQDLRVTQAFAWAGGPMKTARMSQGILVRYDDKGQRQELPVDFDAIMKGKQQDFPVRPDDIIFVPGSKMKNIGVGLLNMAPSALANMAYIIPYMIP
jgi:polysaccharide biosynthesis/export protein